MKTEYSEFPARKYVPVVNDGKSCNGCVFSIVLRTCIRLGDMVCTPEVGVDGRRVVWVEVL